MNILTQFKKNAQVLFSRASAFVARHEKTAKKILACVYSLGDGSVAAAPFIRSGLVQPFMQGTLGWDRVKAVYSDDPAPVLVALAFFPCSLIIGTKWKHAFAAGHAGFFVVTAALMANCFYHHEALSALSLAPTIVGSFFGAFCGPLEKRFGEAKIAFVRRTLGSPKKMVGGFFMSTNGPLFFSSIQESGAFLMPPVCWASGNLITMLLPPEEEKVGQEPTKPLSGKNSFEKPQNKQRGSAPLV